MRKRLSKELAEVTSLKDIAAACGVSVATVSKALNNAPDIGEETRKRIDIMCDTNDGFRIAEADLKLRGPGDLEGTQQSGMAFDLKIADIARDGQLVQMARDEAQKIIEDDPDCTSPRYQMLWNRLRQLRKTNINWAAIS